MNTKFKYLMEHDMEGLRLSKKGDRSSTYDQLIESGIKELPSNPSIIDAGAGSGFVAQIMCEILSKHYASAKLTLLDSSEARLNDASAILNDINQVDIHNCICDLKKIPILDDDSDYTFSRFVFEYLEDPESVLQELIRVTKPGGRIVVGDLDYNCMTHYPIPETLEIQLNELSKELKRTRFLDVNVGRKLFSFFKKNKLDDIKVTIKGHHVFYGKMQESDVYNWEAKMKQLINIQKIGLINLDFDMNVFAKEFMEFILNEDRFSYTPIIIVEAKKPIGDRE